MRRPSSTSFPQEGQALIVRSRVAPHCLHFKGRSSEAAGAPTLPRSRPSAQLPHARRVPEDDQGLPALEQDLGPGVVDEGRPGDARLEREQQHPERAELELPDALERRALEASLELAALRRRLEAAARRAGVARTEGWLPDLSVDLHILRGQPDEPVGTPSDPALRFGGGLTVSIPLFDRQQGRVQAFEAEGRALLERYFGLAVDVRSSAREAENRLASAHARVRHLETVVRPAQDRVLAQTLLQYDAMQLDVFRLLAARRARLEVELAYVDTVNELFVARAAVEALLAGQRVEAPTRAVSPSPGAGAASEGGH